MKRNFLNTLLILLFFAVVLAPTFYTKFRIRTPLIINENRELQKVPKIDLENLKDYPTVFEKFYSDNFGFRQELIWANQKIIDDIFGVDSISSKVLVGKEDWFYSTEYNALKDYQGVLEFNPDLLEKLVSLLLNEYKEAKKYGIKYVFVVVPDKHTIYPEYLPDVVQKNKVRNDTMLDELKSAVKAKEPNFPFLDLRETLLEAKGEKKIYLQTDTHWNDLGAYYGYKAIVEYLGQDAVSLKKFKIAEGKTMKGNLAEMINTYPEYVTYVLERKKLTKDAKISKRAVELKVARAEREKEMMKTVFREEWGFPLDKEFGRHSFYWFDNKDLEKDNLLLFRDSYMDNLMKFLPDHFNRMAFIWLYPCKIRFDLAKKEGFNIVIREVAETRAGLQILRCE